MSDIFLLTDKTFKMCQIFLAQRLNIWSS